MDHREDRREAEDRLHGEPVATRRVGIPVACWVFVLLAIGVVQIVRRQWFDAVVYFLAAAGVVLVALGHSPRRPGRRIALPWLAGGAGVAAAILCFLPRHSAGMQIAVVIIGAVSVAVAWSAAAVARPDVPAKLTPGIRRLALAWALIVVAGCVWELVQFILGLVEPDSTWFALSDLLNPAVESVPGRVAFIAVWIAGGVWLLRRGGAR